VLSDFRRLWQEGFGKLAAVYFVSLFGFVIWVGLLIFMAFLQRLQAAAGQLIQKENLMALAELNEKARVIAFDKDVHKPNAFYIAASDFVEKHPSLAARLNAIFASEGQWADTHHEEVAKAQAEATGVDIEAIRRFVDRSNYRVVPVNDEVIRSQQIVADRFARLGLIPKPVNVSDIVWKWTRSS
jgi:ABC-type nitrate/sulfonate/bicarbonate transport system substrate-binding protein